MSKNFSDVFKELVPDGKAQLIMKRAVDVVSTILHFGGGIGWDTALTLGDSIWLDLLCVINLC